MLSDYLIKIKELYSAIAFLETDLPDETQEVVHEFERVISQVQMLSMIHDRYVIAVSGFQGAGKTTLLNWFVNEKPWRQDDIDNIPWLPERAGVGENLPVLVTCKDNLSEVSATLYYVDKPGESVHGVIAEERIETPDRCSKIVSKPKNKHLLVELFLPTPSNLKPQTGNHFLDEVSFLLLPGYEVIDDKMIGTKKYRQQYMRTALKASANTMIVIDGSHAARGNQEEALQEITKTFKGTKVQYIITHRDVNDGAEVFQKLRDQDVHEQHITHTGTMSDTYTRSLIDDWRSALLGKLTKSSTENQALRESQRDNIKDLTRDVDHLIRQVIHLKDSAAIEETDTVKQMELLLKKFDASVKKIRTTFIEVSEADIGALMQGVREDLDSSQKEKGFLKKWGDWFKEKVFGPETIREFKTVYNESFSNNLDKLDGKQGLLFRIYNKCMNRLGVYADLLDSGDPADIKANAIQKYLPQETYRLDHETINNIQVVAGSELVSSNDPNRKFDRAMSVLPYIIFDSQRLQLVMEGNAWESLFAGAKDYTVAVDSFSQHFKNLQIDTKSFLTGIVALMGGDLLPDGKLDSIGGLFAALFGGGETAAAEGAATTANTSVVVVAGGVVGLLILKSMNDAAIGYNLKKLGTLMSMSDSHEASMKTDMKSEFDAMFIRVRDMIEHRLSDYLQLDVTKGEHLRLQNRIQSCKNLSTDIRSNLREEGGI